jgi:hypothetical protein
MQQQRSVDVLSQQLAIGLQLVCIQNQQQNSHE